VVCLQGARKGKNTRWHDATEDTLPKGEDMKGRSLWNLQTRSLCRHITEQGIKDFNMKKKPAKGRVGQRHLRISGRMNEVLRGTLDEKAM